MFDFSKILCFQLELPNFVQNPLMSQPSLNIKKKINFDLVSFDNRILLCLDKYICYVQKIEYKTKFIEDHCKRQNSIF